MSRTSKSKPWRIADVSFVQVQLDSLPKYPEPQMRVEFDHGVQIIITHADQIPLAAHLIETLRAGKETQS